MDLASAGLKTMRKIQEKWYARGIHLDDVKRTVAQPRTTRQAARLLGISQSDTEEILRALALEPSEDGRWRSRTDSEGELLRLVMDVSEQAAELYLKPETYRTCLEQIFALPEENRRENVDEILQRAHDKDRSAPLDEDDGAQ
jgi:hypothetical protein